MTPLLTFYPIGNADCCLVRLVDGRRLVMDFAATRNDEIVDRRIDLPKALRADIGLRNDVDVLSISHLSEDHYNHVSEVFFLEHDAKYQDNERIKIGELWVPATVVTEEVPEVDEARIIQAEARHRMKEGKGIRVFSSPESLKAWLNAQGLSLSDRARHITHAGCLVPGFSIYSGGVEFFVHSPFSKAEADGTGVIRNSTSLALHATFMVNGRRTRVFFGGNLSHQDLKRVVTVTRMHNNEHRLGYDVVKLPDHCNFLSLGPYRGERVTHPVSEVAWFYERQGQAGAILVSCSNRIPHYDSNGPPHRQAASYYDHVASQLQGEFVVTMAYPTRLSERRIIQIGASGALLEPRKIANDCIAKRTSSNRLVQTIAALAAFAALMSAAIAVMQFFSGTTPAYDIVRHNDDLVMYQTRGRNYLLNHIRLISCSGEESGGIMNGHFFEENNSSVILGLSGRGYFITKDFGRIIQNSCPIMEDPISPFMEIRIGYKISLLGMTINKTTKKLAWRY